MRFHLTLDRLLETIWDPLDNVVFVLIAVAGLYLGVRALSPPGGSREP